MPKNVYGNLYVHRRFVHTLPTEVQKSVAEALPLVPPGRHWNIVRVDPLDCDITFSFYPDFDENPHPELKSWTKIDLKTKQVKCGDYAAGNPFILHLKEAFVDESYPNFDKFKSLSR